MRDFQFAHQDERISCQSGDEAEQTYVSSAIGLP